MPDGEAIEAGIVTRSIESAQRKVEARNFDIRKQLLEYDDVANDQRKVIYQQRNDILEAESLQAQIANLREGTMTDVVRTYAGADRRGAVGPGGAGEGAARGVARRGRAARRCRGERGDQRRGHRRQGRAADAGFNAKLERVGLEQFTPFMRMILLQSIDTTGASTSRRWTTCARASTCAAMRRRIRSRSTSARGLRALQPVARPRQDGGHARSDDGAHPDPGRGRN